MLYTCCSVAVARAVAVEALERAGLLLADLAPEYRPSLIELAWRGEVVDLISPGGIEAAGLPAGYPHQIRHGTTQPLGRAWHAEGLAGVVCRSASLARTGLLRWQGAHERFGEVAIFVANATARPALLRRRADPSWLNPSGGSR